MKNPDEQGETKSRPAEIKKLPRLSCALCGLSGPKGMIVPTGGTTKFYRCANEAACARRVRRTKASVIADAPASS